VARKRAKTEEAELASHVLKSYIRIPEEGNVVGLVLELDNGKEGRVLLKWDAAKDLAETALGACQVLEDRAARSGSCLKGNYFNASLIQITPGYRPDQACITVQAGEGRVRFLIDLDLFMHELARVVKEIEADSSLSTKLH
jgi:hypothetical protein